MFKKFKDSLPGRKQEFHLQSLTFKEFLNFKGESQLSDFTGNFCLKNVFGKHIPAPTAIRLSFWRTHGGSEIDFLIRDMAVEVKYQAFRSAKVPRAVRSGINQGNAQN